MTDVAKSVEELDGSQALTTRDGADEMFCRVFVQTLSFVKAAMVAYKASEENAKHNAGRILKRPHIMTRISWLMEMAAREAMIHPTQLINELRNQAFADHLEVFSDDTLAELGLDNLSQETRRAIEAVEYDALYERDDEGNRTQIGNRVKVKFYSKQKAIEMLARIFALFKDRIEHTGANGEPLPMATISDDNAQIVAAKVASLLERAERRMQIENKEDAEDADIVSDTDVSDLV